jgi:geranylgeranyl diphosphate synthase type 3
LNLWLKVLPEALHIVKKVTDLLHTASLMLDDFQDGSNLRKVEPSTYTIIGAGPTVNSAFFQFVLAVKEIEKLNNANCREVLLGKKMTLASSITNGRWAKRTLRGTWQHARRV